MNIISVEAIQNGRVIQVAPGETLELTYGDKLRITTRFEYRGPAADITLYGAIGVWHPFPEYIPAAFDEIIAAEAKHRTPNSPTAFVPDTASVDIPITADIDAKPDYDIYCKIKEYPDAGMPQVNNVITITGLKPTFELLEETIYPYAYIYEGSAEISTFTFKTDPFTPAKWVGGLFAQHFENEVRKSGGRVMEVRVYVDRSPLLWTDWQIEIVGVPPTGITASIGLAWWAAAILAALAIVFIVVLTWAIKTVAGLFKRNPALEQVKPGWSKETLISAIQDSEEYWKRTPTPVEKLQGMSRQELIDYLDKIAKEEVSPSISWGWVALGVGALGGIWLVSQGKGKKKGA